MKVENLDLHGHNRAEAWSKFENSLKWCLSRGVEVLVINHGKGHHSERGQAVLKQDIRRALKEDQQLRDMLKEFGYKVIYGESNLPVALTFNEGQTLIVVKGAENSHLGGAREQARNHIVYSEEGRQARRQEKKTRQEKDRQGRRT